MTNNTNQQNIELQIVSEHENLTNQPNISEQQNFTNQQKDDTPKCSILGISNILNAEKKIEKVVWIIYCGLTFCLGIYLFVLLVTMFQSNPSNSVYSEEPKNELTFPDITICNLNPLSTIHTKPTWMEYKDFVDNELKAAIHDDKLYLSKYPEFISEAFYLNNIPSLDACRDSCPSNISKCSLYNYKSQKVGQCLMEKIWDPKYHCCTTLKIDQNISKEIKAVKMIIYLPKKIAGFTEIPDGLIATSSIGAKFFLHNAQQPPNINDGYLLSAGSETLVTIKSTIRNRLPRPYSEMGCISVGEQPIYSRDNCVSFCMQDFVILNCSCFSSNYGLKSMNIVEEYKACGNFSVLYNDSTATKAGLDKYLCSLTIESNEDALQKCQTKCPPPCTEILFDVITSTAVWPHVSYYYNIYDKYLKKCPNSRSDFPEIFQLGANYEAGCVNGSKIVNNFEIMNEIRESFMTVQFTRNMMPFRLKENMQYPWPSIFSMVGGTISMWWSINLMSIFQLLYLIIYYSQHLIKTYRKKNN